MGTNPVRLFVRALMSVWALWWVFFAVATVTVGSGGFSERALILTIAAAFFVGSAAVAFCDRPWRPVFLVTEGVILTVLNFTFLHNPPPAQIFLLLTLALPPLLAGILTIVCCPRRRPFPG